jgi:hypothetical protein
MGGFVPQEPNEPGRGTVAGEQGTDWIPDSLGRSREQIRTQIRTLSGFFFTGG